MVVGLCYRVWRQPQWGGALGSLRSHSARGRGDTLLFDSLTPTLPTHSTLAERIVSCYSLILLLLVITVISFDSVTGGIEYNYYYRPKFVSSDTITMTTKASTTVFSQWMKQQKLDFTTQLDQLTVPRVTTATAAAPLDNHSHSSQLQDNWIIVNGNEAGGK